MIKLFPEFPELWEQLPINQHVSASVLNTQVNCIVVLNVSFEMSQMRHLRELEAIDLEKCMTVVIPFCKNTENHIVFLLVCPFINSLNGKMLKRGIRTIVEIFAMKHIYTNIDVVAAFIEPKSLPYLRSKLVNYLKIEKIGAVLHGTVLQLRKDRQRKDDEYTLITGGTRGIGKEAAQELAQQGRNLILTSRSISQTATTFGTELTKKYNVLVEIMALDLQNEQSSEQLVLNLGKMGAKVTCVIHNGAVGTKSCIEQSSKTTPQQTLVGVNTVGPVILHQQLLEKGVIDKNCKITIISSVGAVRIFTEMNRIDLASKGMLQPWIDELIIEGWNVNIIYPGATDTDMFKQSTTNKLREQNLYDEFSAKLPKGFIIEPNLIGKIICMAHQLVNSDRQHVNRIMANCGMFLDYCPLPHVGRQ